jgi:chromosomal replication initiation ATPase DnaA
VYLGVPSQFARDWLSSKFHKDILHTLRSLSESVRAVEYVISRSAKKASEEARTVPTAPAELPLEAVHAKTNLNPRFTLNTFQTRHRLQSAFGIWANGFGENTPYPGNRESLSE